MVMLAPPIRPLQPPVGYASAPVGHKAEVSAAAAQYAQQWLEQATNDECEALIASQPNIPVPLDASLLGLVENEVGGSLRKREDLRRAARRAFWGEIAPRR